MPHISLARYAQAQLLATKQVEALLEAERQKVGAGAYRRALDDTLRHVRLRIGAFETFVEARESAEKTQAQLKAFGLERQQTP